MSLIYEAFFDTLRNLSYECNQKDDDYALLKSKLEKQISTLTKRADQAEAEAISALEDVDFWEDRYTTEFNAHQRLSEIHKDLLGVQSYIIAERDGLRSDHEEVCKTLGMPVDSDISVVLQVINQLCKDLHMARARENQYCSVLGLPLGSSHSVIIDAISDLTDKEIELEEVSASGKKNPSSKKIIAKKKAKKSSGKKVAGKKVVGKKKKTTKKRGTKKS